VTAKGENIKTTGSIHAAQQVQVEAEQVVENKGSIFGERIKVRGRNVSNDGTINAQQDLVVTAEKDLTNHGQLIGDSVTAKGENIKTTGSIHGTQQVRVEAAQDVENKGSIFGERVKVKGRNISNDGTVNAQKDLSVTAEEKFVNHGGLEGQAVTVLAQNIEYSGSLVASSGQLKAQENLDLRNANLQTENLSLAAQNMGIKDSTVNITKQGIVTAEHLKKVQGSHFSGESLAFDLGGYEDGGVGAVHMADGMKDVKKVDLRMGKEDFVNDTKMDLQHSNLGVSFKSVTNKGEIASSGMLKMHGDDSFTNEAGHLIFGKQGLGTSTDGLHLNLGTLSGGKGDNIVKGQKIESFVTHYSVDFGLFSFSVPITVHCTPKYEGQNIVQQAKEGISHQGTQILAGKNFDATTERGNIKLLPADKNQQNEGNQTPDYQSVQIKAGDRITVKTPDQIIAPTLQANAGGEMLLQGDKGIDIDSRGATVVGNHHNKTDVLAWQTEAGYTESANFHRAHLQAGSTVNLQAEKGKISAQGAQLKGEHVTMSARDDIELGAEKSKLHSEKKTNTWWGARNEEESSTIEQAAVFEAKGKSSVKINSKQGTVRSTGGTIEGPQVTLGGKKGIEWNEVELETKTIQKVSSLIFELFGIGFIEPSDNISLVKPQVSTEEFSVIPSVSIGYKTTHSQATTSSGLQGSIKADKFIVHTGEGSQTNLPGTNLKGFSGKQVKNMEVDSSEIFIGGSKHNAESNESGFKAELGVSYVGSFVPKASVEIEGKQSKKQGFDPAQVNIGHLENKRKGLHVFASQGCQGGIDSSKGEDFILDVKHTQTTQTQNSYTAGLELGLNELSASLGAKWEKHDQPATTNFKTRALPNLPKRKDTLSNNQHVGVGINLDFSCGPTHMETSASLQVKNKSHGINPESAPLQAGTPLSSINSDDMKYASHLTQSLDKVIKIGREGTTLPSENNMAGMVDSLTQKNMKLGKTTEKLIEVARVAHKLRTWMNSVEGSQKGSIQDTSMLANKVENKIKKFLMTQGGTPEEAAKITSFLLNSATQSYTANEGQEIQAQ
ncbi:MAG: hypothetical protein Q8929_08815, partial [Bacillota bacterium]|nr:hypothetical protein [Bacillota bacterium]